VIGAATPGDVMVLSSNGHLRCCDTEYDRKVVGVISGAGGFTLIDLRPIRPLVFGAQHRALEL
jgi:hypothetical protein